jgi:hypothetical protein
MLRSKLGLFIFFSISEEHNCQWSTKGYSIWSQVLIKHSHNFYICCAHGFIPHDWLSAPKQMVKTPVMPQPKKLNRQAATPHPAKTQNKESSSEDSSSEEETQTKTPAKGW